ncbi:hypothetical protein ACQP3F_32805, partial [Escherichia coli]
SNNGILIISIQNNRKSKGTKTSKQKKLKDSSKDREGAGLQLSETVGRTQVYLLFQTFTHISENTEVRITPSPYG